MQNLLLIAVGPTIAILMFFYYVDKFDREPLGLLIRLFVGGMLVVIPIFIVETLLMHLNFLPGIFGVAFTAFVVAGFTEEFFKRQVVLKVAYKDSHFNEHLDGIIYCVFASLGMATVENVLYIFTNANPVMVGLMRGVISVPMHMLFAVTMGYYLAFAKFAEDPTKKRRYFTMSLTQPILLHGIFDFLILSGQTVLTFIAFGFVFYSWMLNYKKLKVYYEASKQAHLTGESEKSEM